MKSKPYLAACAAGGLLVSSLSPLFCLADEAVRDEKPAGEARGEDGQPRPERRRDREGPAEGRPGGSFGPGGPRERMRPGIDGAEGGDMRQQFMQRMGEILDRLDRLERRIEAGPGMRDGRPPLEDGRREGPRPEWQSERRGEGFRPEPRGPREGDRPPAAPGGVFERPGMPEEMRRRMEERMQEGRGMMDQARQRMEEARQRFEDMQKRIEELEAEVKRLKAAD
jgi:hypothetical protein